MPACKKCGTVINESGTDAGEYCEDCRAKEEKRIERLLAVAELERPRPPRRLRGRWLIIAMLAVAAILVATAAGLVISVPTDPEFRERSQASVCRSNIRRVQLAADRYFQANGTLTPPGRVGGSHPLLIDQYIVEPPRCPTTKRYYVVEEVETGRRARCDSGIAGHE